MRLPIQLRRRLCLVVLNSSVLVYSSMLVIFFFRISSYHTVIQDVRTTLWVEEWNALGDRSTEWRDRGIIPNEHLASGTDEPWSTWRSLNRLRERKGRCRAMMKIWNLSHTDVCDCGERQSMSHLKL